MANFYTDNEDLQFYVEKAINWDEIARLTEVNYSLPEGFKSADEAKEFYFEVLEMVGNFVADEIAPVAHHMDANPLKLVDGEVEGSKEYDAIFENLAEMGLHGLCLPREFGGMNAPLMVYMLNAELFARADVSLMTHHSFHGGIALALLFYSVMEGSTEFDFDTMTLAKSRFKEVIEEICEGKAWGSMDITEPNAGSDMAALRCKGECDADGQWTVTGEKCFITSGHGKYHLVIARTEPDEGATEGLKGLSFFLVPGYEDTPEGRKRFVRVETLEEKIGHKNSATCTVVFDRSPAHLIGKRGEGFKYMLLLMNNARLGVGFEGLGTCEAAYRMSRDYAAERVSMGKTIDKHEMIADYLDEMKTDVQAIRALTITATEYNELAQRAETHLMTKSYRNEQERKEYEMIMRKYKRKARRLTPLLKYYGAEKAVDMSRRAMQIHGGSGYTKEYGAEKLLRDALVLPIYEGTSQIQSLMATKDELLGMAKDPARALRRAAKARWSSVTSSDRQERSLGKLQSIADQGRLKLMAKVLGYKVKDLSAADIPQLASHFKSWDVKKDFAPALLHAEKFTQILCDVAIAEILFDHAKRFPERSEVFDRFVERALPRCQYWIGLIDTTGERILAELADQATRDSESNAA